MPIPLSPRETVTNQQPSASCLPIITVSDPVDSPPPSSSSPEAVHASTADPLPLRDQATTSATASPSPASLKPGTDLFPRPKFTYPRFSMVTTLANTGGPGFSIEELTSTDVSEDEDAILHEPCLRRRTLSRLSWQPPVLPTVPSESGSQAPSDRILKTADYLRQIVISLLQALMAYLRAGDKRSGEASPLPTCHNPVQAHTQAP